MKADIKIHSNYGFDHNWTLEVETPTKFKSFYLGQDVKFVSRVLQTNALQLCKDAGATNDMTDDRNRKRLAMHLVRLLRINGQNLHLFEPWAFCAQ